MTISHSIIPEPRPSRRALHSAAAALLALAALSQAPHALAQDAPGRGGDPQAEQFVQAGAQRILSILADRGLSAAQKDAKFQPAINDLADVPKITNFVLGKYARTITPAQRQQFATVFRAYAETAYRSRLDDYHGETLKVTGSVVRKPGDVIVNTVVSGGQLAHPAVVAWRVLGAGGAWKVVDVQFKGVWLAITQQQDFVSTIDNAGGDIGVLIAQLQRDTERATASSR
jgi:phospholipid transport system substrate-binding protein